MGNAPYIAMFIFPPSFHISLQRLGGASRNFAGVFRRLIRSHLAKKNWRKRMGNAPYIAMLIFPPSIQISLQRLSAASRNFAGVFRRLIRSHTFSKKNQRKQMGNAPHRAILIFPPSIQISLQRLSAASRHFAGVFRSLIRLHLAKKIKENGWETHHI